jgi:hypothetical protein
VQDVERLHALLQVHGVAATRAAFTHGLTARVFGAEYIAHYLAAPAAPAAPVSFPDLAQ